MGQQKTLNYLICYFQMNCEQPALLLQKKKSVLIDSKKVLAVSQ